MSGGSVPTHRARTNSEIWNGGFARLEVSAASAAQRGAFSAWRAMAT